ncbi:MAG: Unknown protein, partial [uncultured Aureispira sp.]
NDLLILKKELVQIETYTILLYLFIAVISTVHLGNILYKRGGVLLSPISPYKTTEI